MAWGERDQGASGGSARAAGRAAAEPARGAPAAVRLPAQLIHGDLGGNVLFAAGEPPAVIDFSPYWRPAGLALAVAAVDALTWSERRPAILDELAHRAGLDQLLARAHVASARHRGRLPARRPGPFCRLETVTRTGDPVTALVLERLAAGRVVWQLRRGPPGRARLDHAAAPVGHNSSHTRLAGTRHRGRADHWVSKYLIGVFRRNNRRCGCS